MRLVYNNVIAAHNCESCRGVSMKRNIYICVHRQKYEIYLLFLDRAF